MGCPLFHRAFRGLARGRDRMNDVTWTDLMLVSGIALTLLFLPGMIIGWMVGVRGFLLAALAPPLSTTIIAVSAIVAGFLGVPWTWVVPATVTLGLAGLTAAAVQLASLRGWQVRVTRNPAATWRCDLPLWAGGALAAGLIGSQLKDVFGRPNAFSQTYDNVFHMAAVRYALETGNASSLAIGGVTRVDSDPGFYPAAFHGVVALVVQGGTHDIALGFNAVAIAIAAFVWPFACLGLVRLALPESATGVLGAAVLVASFATFPILLLDFGVLYPNLFALALVPALFGLLIQLLGLHGPRHVSPLVSAGLLMAMLPGLTLAHPNAVMTLIALSIAPMVAWFLRSWRREWSTKRRRVELLRASFVLMAFIGVSLFAWLRVRPSAEGSLWLPIASAPQAVGEALLNATPGGGRAAWVLSFFVCAGVVVACRTHRGWLVGSWATIVGLLVVVSAFAPSDLRSFLTGIWYNDPLRFSATLPLVAFPLSVLGVHSLGQTLIRRLHERSSGRPAIQSRRRWPVLMVVPLGLVIALAAGTQRAPYLQSSIEVAAEQYALSWDSPLVSADEYDLILRVPDLVDADAVVATNPQNGSSMLYALTGVETTTTHIAYNATADQQTIRYHLDDAAHSVAVCSAVRRMGITHALDFGPRELDDQWQPYPGLLGLSRADGFREVAREGAAVLYQLTVCQ